MVDSHVIRSILLWPNQVQDKDILKKLTTITFDRISNMQRYLPEINSGRTDGRFFGDMILMWKSYSTEKLKHFQRTYEKYGLKEEIESVLDSLWNMDRDIQQYAYPEPIIYGWKEFKYGKDSWRKLFELTKKHPDQNILQDFVYNKDKYHAREFNIHKKD